MPKINYIRNPKIKKVSDITDELGEDINPKRTVFIFPGNASNHHKDDGSTDSLYKASIWGANLAAAGNMWAKSGHPTLSLPTVFPAGSTQDAQGNIAKRAIQALYKAVGAGFDLALPVRTYKEGKFFDAPLEHTSESEQEEPSFWGAVVKKPNKTLATLYIKELNTLHSFIALLQGGQVQEAKDLVGETSEHWQAYQAGQHAAENIDDWCGGIDAIPVHNTKTSLPYIEIKGHKIAPFKEPDAPPYGAFANTTKAGEFRITQAVNFKNGPITYQWPSSEHAYHAQKLLCLIARLEKEDGKDNEVNALKDTLKILEKRKSKPGQEFHPRKDWDAIINQMLKAHPHCDFGKNKDAFEKLCVNRDWTKHKAFMKDVIKMKLTQYPELDAVAKQMVIEEIFPVEVSEKDKKWASGGKGNGKNLLGITILEVAKERLSAEEVAQIKKPIPVYTKLSSDLGAELLKHDSLIPSVGKLGEGIHSVNALRKIQLTSKTFLSDLFIGGRKQKEAAMNQLLYKIQLASMGGDTEKAKALKTELFKTACRVRSKKGGYSTDTASAKSLIKKFKEDPELREQFEISDAEPETIQSIVETKMSSACHDPHVTDLMDEVITTRRKPK